MTQIFLSSFKSATDKNLIKLLEFYEIKCLELKVDSNINPGSCLFLNCDELNLDSYNLQFKEFIITKFSCIFFYNVSNNSTNLIKLITDVTVSLTEIKNEDLIYKVSDSKPDICKQLTGQIFFGTKANCKSIFRHNDSSVNSLIYLNDGPYFIHIEKYACEFFAVAGKSIIDLSQEVFSNDFKISNFFPYFAPILMLLKYVFKNNFWNASSDYACFIIDDPLLKKRYGFLNFKKLLSSMEEYKFCSSIAFIPYNFNRTKSEIASMFNNNRNRYSILIHGCDHCEAEFGICDEKELNRKAILAQSLMNKHKVITGIEHDNVMVFPQGSFSSIALKVLKSNNYLSAINSKIIADEIDHLKISSYLDPVITDYFSFPLFIRRYPLQISDFALDLFLNRPIFIVEHHGYFKDNCRKLCDYIKIINSNFHEIKWLSPQNIIKNFYLIKNEGSFYKLRIFTNHTIIKNKSNEKISYIISKKEDHTVPIEKILINDVQTNYRVRNDLIIMHKFAKPNEIIEIKIIYKSSIEQSKDPGIIYKHKLFLRRIMTEFRDNFLDRYESFSRIASIGKKLIKKFVA